MPAAGPTYPVNLVLRGKRCLVVGGGRVAARKIQGLLAAGAVVRVVATSVGDEVRALPISWEERPYRRGEVKGEWLVVAATDDPAVNRAVFDDGEAAGVWVNSADDPDHCSFVLPAVARRGPITIAVSTGGHSPALAAWLRSRLDAELGPEYEALADLLAAERDAIRASGRSTEGLDWQRALESDILLLVREGRIQQARERLQACLSSSSD